MTKIMLDPGHGGRDPGATANGIREKDINLELAKGLKKKLESGWYCEVLMTRTTDVFLSLSDRASIANKAKVDFFFSLHSNAGGGRGYEDFIFNGTVPRSTINKRDTIHPYISGVWLSHNRPNRGKKRANFGVLRMTHMCAMLIENGFLDNSTDASLLKQTSFKQELIDDMAVGIASALKLKNKATKPDPEPDNNNNNDDLPAVKRAIGVKLRGENTNLNGWYVDGETVAGVNKLIENIADALAVEIEVVPHGSYIDIVYDEVEVGDAVHILRRIVGLE